MKFDANFALLPNSIGSREWGGRVGRVDILSLILKMISKVIELIDAVIVSWLLWICPCIFEDREDVYITIDNEKFY